MSRIFAHWKIAIALLLLTGISFSTKNADFPREESFEFSVAPIKLTNEVSEISTFDPLDSAFNKFVKDWRLVGASVAVMKEGKLLYAKGFGKPEYKSEESIQPYHQFRLASVSKLITATAVLELVEEGKISLDSRVFGANGILSAEPYMHAADSRVFQITVEQLLRHTAGWSLLTFGDPMFKPVYIANQLGIDGPPTFEQIAAYTLSTYRLPYRPGTRYEYSNFGYCVLTKVIEEASKMSYEDYVRYNILLPNDIKHMALGFNSEDERLPLEVKHYDNTRGNMRESYTGSGKLKPTTYGVSDIRTLSGAGGWVGSSTELLRLVTLIDGYQDKPDILEKETILNMIDTDVPGRSPIGWRRIYDDWTWMRTGTLAGTSAIVMRQDDGLTWVVLVNTSNWRSRRFNTYMKWMMRKTLAEIKDWPQRDLFMLM